MSTALTEAEKARIEAEEHYRAEVRAKLENAPIQSVTSDSGEVEKVPIPTSPIWKQLLYWTVLTVIGVSLGAAAAQYEYTKSRSSSLSPVEALLGRFTNQPTAGLAESAELTIIRSSDNYKLTGYFILKDSRGEEIAGQGKVKLTVKIKPYDGSEPVTILDKQFQVSPREFFKGTRGLGAFKRDVVAFQLEDFSFSEYSGESIEAELSFLNDELPVVYIKARETAQVP